MLQARGAWLDSWRVVHRALRLQLPGVKLPGHLRVVLTHHDVITAEALPASGCALRPL